MSESAAATMPVMSGSKGAPESTTAASTLVQTVGRLLARQSSRYVRSEAMSVSEHVVEEDAEHAGGRERSAGEIFGVGGHEERAVLVAIGDATVRSPHQRRVEGNDLHQVAEPEQLAGKAPGDGEPGK